MAAIFSIGFLFLASAFSSPGQSQKQTWRGKIETENGIKVVKNPVEPVYGEFILELQEDLRLGGNPNDQNYYFPKGAWLNVDDEGNIFVLDYGNRRVQKYDKSGKYVQTIGRQGQGPGEYQFPSRLQFDAEGNPIIFDSRMAHVFTPDATFKKRILLKAFTNDTIVTSAGFIFGRTQARFEKGGPKESVAKMDAEGALVGNIAEFRNEFSETQNVMAWHAYNHRLCLSLISSSSFCYGFSSEYAIYVADAEGRTSLIIKKEEKPKSITGKEKDEIKKEGPFAAVWRSGNPKPEEGMVFPDHRPYFAGLVADDNGHIYLTKLKSVIDKGPDFDFDVFSSDGYYLYKMRLPFRPVVIKNGAVYEIRRDEEGETAIVRHRVKNWDQIKKGLNT